MKLILKNFRRHRNETFILPEEGLVALSGKKGSGKSTILAAISFAFFGVCPSKKRRKNHSHGSTSGTIKVELIYDRLNLQIVRSSKKNLVVSRQVRGKTVVTEGTAAQSTICSVLGMTYEEFLVSSYIYQGAETSVLSMTPTEQLHFVETLAKQNVEGRRESLKKESKLWCEEKNRLEGQLAILKSQLEEGAKQLEQRAPKEPNSESDLEENLAAFEKLELTRKNLIKKLDSANEKLDDVRRSEKEVKRTVEKIELTNSEIKNLEKKISACESELPDLPHLEKLVKKAEAKVLLARKKERWLEEKVILKEALKEHATSTKKQISELEKDTLTEQELETLRGKVEKLDGLVKEFTSAKLEWEFLTKKKSEAKLEVSVLFSKIRAVVDIDQNESYSDLIKNVKKPLEMAKIIDGIISSATEKRPFGDKTLKCPGCKGKYCIVLKGEDPVLSAALAKSDGRKLTFEESRLDRRSKLVVDEKTSGTLGRWRDRLKILAADLSVSIPDFDPEDDPSPKFKTQSAKLELALSAASKIRVLKKGLVELPFALERMRARVEECSELFRSEDETLPKMEKLARDFAEYQEKLTEAKVFASQLETMKGELQVKKKFVEKLKRSVSEDDPKENSTDVEKEIKKLVAKISDTSVLAANLSETIEAQRLYQKHLEFLASRKKLARSVKKISAEVAEIDDLFVGAKGFEATLREAQILSLQKTINDINFHAKTYLDQLFEEPISVRLDCVIDKGKQGLKLAINTKVEYEDEVYDDVCEFSGGEGQQCEVAFLLGVNEMKNSPIIMLDECLNSLGNPFNQDCLQIIKEMTRGKLVLVVAHEAIRGIFDEEVIITRRG